MKTAPKRFLLALPLVLGAASQAVAQGAPMNLFPKKGAPASRAISRAAPPPRVSDKSDAAVIESANKYFNGVRTMVANFTQIGADGRQIGGRLYLQKPGKLRFEYDPPSPLQIIADGTSVAIRNKKTAKQDLYHIRQTPLKFLLRRNLNLARDTKVMEVKATDRESMIRIEDKATFGGTSRIRLYFDPKTYALRKWIVRDAQGYRTQVVLADVDLRKKPSPSLFKINYERLDTDQ